MLVRCPAKVNLFLSVGPRDESGYHPLQTVFQAVGLYDELLVEEAGEDSLTCDWDGLPAENTLTKALRLLRELVPLPPLRLVLTKRIPAESGLGGGSSDAAGLIRAARKMMSDHCPERFAREVAAAVGADVPFFLVGGRAKGAGYGEIVEPLADGDRRWLLIVKPEEGVVTSAAYAALDRGVQARRPTPQSGDLETLGMTDWGDLGLHNDFGQVAPKICRELSEKLLALGADGSLLCGSGSAVFGVFGSESDAVRAQGKMQPERSWIAPTLTREESLWTS
ncbi:MAG: 4-(cytidine 5'-diphospho)-2-C-methyl-D-erythritol kinase [Armatimonadetes bacterium]|nr:4-(cytidine 5'-diphospho)-2-C-methyl-D-erythritol kinase [Armatimonadota bacterium]